MKVIIVGAGISGLATAQALLNRQPELEISVLEGQSRAGGKVWSERTGQGYLCEWGVNGFLDKEPSTLALCDQLGLGRLSGDEAAKRRYVFSAGKLHKLPEKPPQFLTSQLLSPGGRLRVLWEAFVSSTGPEDETLAAFATRRLGREAADKLIDPMASGIWAGDSSRMSLKSCFPRIHEIETEYGSLIRGLVKLQKKARREGSKNTPGPGPGGTLTSFESGMEDLITALMNALGDRVRLACPVESVSFDSGRFQVYLANGRFEEADRLVLAVPAYAQAALLTQLSAGLSQILSEIEYPPVAVCCLGYRLESLQKQPDGFGYLVPSGEKRSILGTVIDSNVFPNRAPDGAVLLRTLLGGARTPQFALQPEERVIETVRSELKATLGISADPEFASVYSHQRAIPQYQVGHADRLEKIESALQSLPGLQLTGNAFRGVSLNDCVLNAQKTAGAMTPALN